MTELCDCGAPLHYDSEAERARVEADIQQHGPEALVAVKHGSPRYWVPRHYLALHGVMEADLPALAALYGWRRA